MLNWEKRPFEIANLINPAFCALILHASIGGFSKEKKIGMPYALVFLILPMILHEPTRNTLPLDTRENFFDWFKEQQEEFGRVLAYQICQFVPYTREALIFGMQRSIISVDDDGNIIQEKKNIHQTQIISDPIISLMNSSRFLGRWFAKSEHESLIFKTLGICI